MGWEIRRGSTKRYYTLTWSVAGKRRRFYVGAEGDPVAETADAYVTLDRVVVELARRKAAAEQAAFTPAQLRHAEAATAALAAMFGPGGPRLAPSEMAHDPSKPADKPASPRPDRD